MLSRTISPTDMANTLLQQSLLRASSGICLLLLFRYFLVKCELPKAIDGLFSNVVCHRFQNMGYQWAGTMLALIATLMVPLPVSTAVRSLQCIFSRSLSSFLSRYFFHLFSGKYVLMSFFPLVWRDNPCQVTLRCCYDQFGSLSGQ